MRSSIVAAAVLIAPALIGARPLATPGTKMVLNPDTYSPPAFSGAPMPAEHTSPHHFADGVTDEGLKRMMRGHDKTLATPKEEIIVHPYRPFADPTMDRDREHFELFEKVHPRDFSQNMRNTDNTERPHPDDHHLRPKIGTPKNARATDYTKILPHPNGHLLPPKIGTPINARAIDNIEMSHPNDHHLGPKIGTPKNARVIDITERPHPNDHHLGPKVGTPKNARAMDGTESFPRPNGQFLPPKIGTPINARAIHGTERLTRPDGLLETPSWGGPVGTPIDTPIGEISTDDEEVERPHPNDHHLGSMIGSPISARAVDSAERLPHPNGHHLGPKIGTPINAKREESGESEELGDLEEIPVDLPISSDYYPGQFDDLEEIPVDLPISMDYYPDYDPEEFDDPEEMSVDLPIISDSYPESSDYEDSRYIPATPGDRNSRRPGRLAGPPYPYAGPVHFNGIGFNNTINGTAFNNTINGTAFNNATNITTEAINCSERTASDSEEPAEPALKRRGQGHTGELPEVIQSFENQRKQQAQKAAQNQAAKDMASKEKADKEKANMERKAREKETKEKNRGSSSKNRPNKSSPDIMDHAPELFEYFKDPFNKPFPHEDDKKFSEEFSGNLDRLRHPFYWAPGGDKTEHPKQEPGHEWREIPRPKPTDEKTGFKQGDGWKTDYWQKGVGIQQPRVPDARRPYWAEGNPVY